MISEFQNKLFYQYSESLKREISLLDTFSLPQFKSWKIDWWLLTKIIMMTVKGGWNNIPIYNELLSNKNNPVLYYFTTTEQFSCSIFDSLKEAKGKSSQLRLSEGIKNEKFYNISHVPKLFCNSNCIYVGSTKKNINGRLIQHLGFGSNRTGALNLITVLDNLDVKPDVFFHYYILDKKYKNLTEHIECVLYDNLKPFIGKRPLRK